MDKLLKTIKETFGPVTIMDNDSSTVRHYVRFIDNTSTMYVAMLFKGGKSISIYKLEGQINVEG